MAGARSRQCVFQDFAHGGWKRCRGEFGRRDPDALAVRPRDESGDIGADFQLQMRKRVADDATLAELRVRRDHSGDPENER